jgi:hypothetical protein
VEAVALCVAATDVAAAAAAVTGSAQLHTQETEARTKRRYSFFKS